MEDDFIIPDSPPLKDIVCAFWQINRLNSPLFKETIIPKGVVEIIFNFSDTHAISARIDRQSITVPRCFIQGFHTRPIQLSFNGQQTFFGAVLFPAVTEYVFGCPPAEFANRVTDLTLVNGLLSQLWHQLLVAKTFDGRVTIFSEWLRRRVPQLNNRDRAFNKFLTTHADIALSVPNLAENLCYSAKQLSRRLYQLTGMNAEQTLLYKKYLLAVHLMHHTPLSLTKIAYTCHFSDQSHFTKTFKSLASITPKEYRLRKSPLAGHIFENVR